MGERKVLNKYYPPDFDPTLIPRARRPKNEQYKVRMMVPMSIRCLTCGEFIYKGKKFNARKETVQGEEYLGIKIFRFYVKCTRCSSEITIKTDPKNSDYTCEMGATRNFEGWKEGEKMMEQFRKQREEEEMGNAMKALENKTLDNKMEMDILDGLDEIRSLNAKASKVDPMQILEHIQNQDKNTPEEIEEDPDELETLNLLLEKQAAGQIKRLPDEPEISKNPQKTPNKRLSNNKKKNNNTPNTTTTNNNNNNNNNSSNNIKSDNNIHTEKKDNIDQNDNDSNSNSNSTDGKNVTATYKVPLPRLPKKVVKNEQTTVTIGGGGVSPVPTKKEPLTTTKAIVQVKFSPKFRKTTLVKRSDSPSSSSLVNY